MKFRKLIRTVRGAEFIRRVSDASAANHAFVGLFGKLRISSGVRSHERIERMTIRRLQIVAPFERVSKRVEKAQIVWPQRCDRVLVACGGRHEPLIAA